MSEPKVMRFIPGPGETFVSSRLAESAGTIKRVYQAVKPIPLYGMGDTPREAKASVNQVERIAHAAPEMLELLREAGQWYCGELPDGTDRRDAIRKLVTKLDGK